MRVSCTRWLIKRRSKIPLSVDDTAPPWRTTGAGQPDRPPSQARRSLAIPSRESNARYVYGFPLPQGEGQGEGIPTVQAPALSAYLRQRDSHQPPAAAARATPAMT